MSEFTITIKMTGDKKHEVTVSPEMTVLQLKEKIASDLDISVDRQRLIFSGKVLKDNDTLDVYKIKQGHSIHLVKGAANLSQQKLTPPIQRGKNPSTSAVPSNIESGQGAFNPLAGLTDARYAGYNIPMPTMDQLGFGADGMQLPPENQLEQMMDNPLFQESMRSMLSNPQMLDYMIQQSPQLRAMGPAARELLQSDYVKNMLTNPQAMRSMMEMQRAMGGIGATGANTNFPSPGNPTDSNTANTDSPSNSTSNSSGSSVPSNPFASLFGAGVPGAGLGGNPFLANPNLMNLFGGASTGTGSAAPSASDTRPPEEVYATQLRQLNDMGFFDFDRNIAALRRSGGSVEGAIEMLLNGSV
ncbi:Ubiquitin domain-containing protein DSK2 [Pichia kudriavzevii]|uniref:Ubiquitin domain-containing protein DSK2 n=1 Tax=Pichia kudriavzevii TaxID=4909 RepID=A0A1V2LF13_PICKU|nr:Ubiquitin domain-containing protein DSK2 [Pichia kudriavzevii]